MCYFLNSQTHLFHALPYKKEIVEDISIHSKRKESQHVSEKPMWKKTQSKFHGFLLRFQFFELWIWTFMHEVRRNPKCPISGPLFFKIKPYFSFYWYCGLIQFIIMVEEENLLMKNTKPKRYKILTKKRKWEKTML